MQPSDTSLSQFLVSLRHSDNFFIRFVLLARRYWCEPEHKVQRRKQTLFLFLLTVAQIVIAVLTTQWSAALFDALDKHSMTDLFKQIGLIVLIFIANIVVTVTHLNVKRALQVQWREWLSDYLIGRWMRGGNHYLVTHIKGEHDNPDGRIAEDVKIATESAIDMAHSLIYSVLMLISFITILWSLSGLVTIDLWLVQIPIYGHLVWLALAYAGVASWIGWRIAKPLTAATNARQTAEANFRSSLITARENSQAIALVHGEPTEQKHLHALFAEIVSVWQQQTQAFARIMSFTSGYSVLSMAFPLLVSAPRYILGSISLGALVQSAQSFQYTIAALSWPVDNTARIAEWRASVERLLGLIQALDDLEQELNPQDPRWIAIEKSTESRLILHKVCITKLNGDTVTFGLDADIGLGERVLLSGNSSASTKLFRAILGCRPWGCGRISLPAQALFYMPPRPYLPAGNTLRAAICYPAEANAFSQEAIEDALKLVDLTELIEQLNQTYEWGKILERAVQQRLGLVRLLLVKPQWILLQEAFDSLSPSDEEAVLRLICQQLPDSSLLTISNLPSALKFHHSQLVLP
jgi:putative ATP-binding cassette transporter